MSKSKLKKGLLALAAATLLLPAQALAHEGQTHVEVNGVSLDSKAISPSNGKTFVELDSYSNLVGATYSKNANGAMVNGTEVSTKDIGGKAFVHIREIAAATGAENISWDPHSSLVYVLDLPDGYIELPPFQAMGKDVKETTVVAGMGVHWANPADPSQPVLGTYEGKLVFMEHLIPKAVFESGTSIADQAFLKGKPAPAVDHVDFEFLANGLPIPGLDGVPLYAPHYYFVSHEEHLEFGIDEVAKHDHDGEFSIDSVEVVNATTVKVKFNEKLADSVTNVENKHFTIEHRGEDGSVKHYHNPAAISLNVVKQTATLTVAPALHEDVTLHLVIDGVTSADGDTLESVEKEITYTNSIVIDINKFAFETTELTIKKGTKVTWVNSDTAPHTVTEFNGLFDSGNLAPGDSYSYTFNDAGSFDYYCYHHPEMVGKIIVE